MHFHVLSKRQGIAWFLLIVLVIAGITLGLDRLINGTKEPQLGEDDTLVAAFAWMPEETEIPATEEPSMGAVKEINLFAPPENTQTANVVEETPVPSKEAVLDTPAPSMDLQIQVVRPDTSNASTPKKILIYHTHTYEAYEPTETYTYKQTEKWRTKDERCNVVCVGEELSRLLTAFGYEVVHDTGAYEPPVLSTSYTRSLAMLEQRTSDGETYDLYIDLHRDAYTKSMEGQNTVNVNGLQLARVMVLIGKGTGQSFDIKPEWEKNYAIAQSITNALNEQVDGLCRRISLKTGRFNQHIAPQCILIEAGNNMNTLDEVLASMPYVADAIDQVLNVTE